MKNIIRILKTVFSISPLRMAVYLLLRLPGALLPAVLLSLQRQVVDNAASLTQDFSLFHYMKPVLLLIGVYMVLKLSSLVSKQYMEFGYFRYVFMGLDAKIHKKSAQIPLEYYDCAQYYQIVQNAKQSSMFLVFTANLSVLLFVLVCNLLSVGGYLASINPLLIIFVVLVSVPVIIEKLWDAKYQAGLMQDLAQPLRRKNYAFSLLSSEGSKKELSHYGASHYIAGKYLEACSEVNLKECRQVWQVGRTGIIFAGVKSLLRFIAVFIMVWMLVTGRITIGGFSVLLASFTVLTNSFTQLFSHAGEILHTSVMSASFFTLMDFDIKDGTEDMEINSGIAHLEHVFYKYPGAKDYALKDISLSVKKGEKIAIAGENGAGKTTLEKLLSGFLLPSEGLMEMGGIPRCRLRENSIFRHISAVYQEFGHYKLTLAQNVYLADTIQEMDIGKICNALEQAGISVPGNPEEILLGREFGGTGLSGGQWQRLALARSYYRERPVLFLDEPTASIDPLEEMAIYERINELAGERTVIMATHRLGAIRSASKIIVMEDGKIVEMGNFEQLMKKQGRFYCMWNEQAQWYKEGLRKEYN